MEGDLAAGAESGMYSSSAASTVSGCGEGSASSSNAEALALGGGAAECDGNGAGAEDNDGTEVDVAETEGKDDGCCFAATGAAGFETLPAGLAVCPLRNKPRATRNVPLDCST